ncbi:MAG: hypothetical protein WKF60_09640, partial [Ilumatobacter sp.]
MPVRPLVPLSIAGVDPKTVAEPEHPCHLLAADAEDVQIARRVVEPEHTVLIPLRFASAEVESERV